MRRDLRSWLAVCSICVALAGQARAEAPGSKQAAAEIFFQEGVALIEEGALAKACAKFEASQRLDPALGTMLRLADCYDRAGQTASAWRLFQDAAALARERNDAERLQLAEVRSADAEGRLSKLKLVLEGDRPAADTTIHVNGVALAAGAWSDEIPVDPGPQRVEVSAPRRLPWSTVADVPAGPATRVLRVPSLALAPDAQQEQRAASGASEVRRRPLRALGYVLAGVGAAGLVAGGLLARAAKQSNERSLEECRPDDASACTEQGVQQREDAQALANGATAAFVAGGVFAASGVLLALLSPARDTRKSAARGVRLSAGGGARALALRLEGRW